MLQELNLLPNFADCACPHQTKYGKLVSSGRCLLGCLRVKLYPSSEVTSRCDYFLLVAYPLPSPSRDSRALRPIKKSSAAH